MRPRPQVIYHLPRASNYAATLHSQAKGQNNDLPVDSSMPTSLQMSHANANAAAQQARREAANPPPQQQQQQEVKRAKSTTHRSTHPRSVKTKAAPNNRPNKTYKK